MDKQEMAEWLAESVLGWVRVNFIAEGYKGENWIWKIPNSFVSYPEKSSSSIQTIYEFIYSPDGFFAVLDAVEAKLEGGEDDHGIFAEALHGINFSPKEDGRDCCAITTSTRKSYGRGTTRTEAFYSAVKEAWPK